MIKDADRSSDVVAEDPDADKKPAASVNKIGAPSLKRPPGSKKAKKELRLRDTSLSGSTAAGAVVMGRIADSHNRMTVRLSKMWRRCIPLQQKFRTNTSEKRSRLSKLFMY
jgi:hypothetical protein